MLKMKKLKRTVEKNCIMGLELTKQIKFTFCRINFDLMGGKNKNQTLFDKNIQCETKFWK